MTIRECKQYDYIQGIAVPTPSEALRLLHLERKAIEQNMDRGGYHNNVQLLIELDEKISYLLKR